MSVLARDIAAFERMRKKLESAHLDQWVVFHEGVFVGVFDDFDSAASTAVERFDLGPYLICKVGAPPVQLPGGMIFTPAHSLGASRV